MNVQAVCSHDLKFTNIVAKWPGYVHESRVFRNNRLCAKFVNHDFNGTFVTPILN